MYILHNAKNLSKTIIQEAIPTSERWTMTRILYKYV